MPKATPPQPHRHCTCTFSTECCVCTGKPRHPGGPVRLGEAMAALLERLGRFSTGQQR